MSNITDLSFLPITTIKTLDLSYTEITANQLATHLSQATELEDLSLESCNIDEKVIESISQLNKVLLFIYIIIINIYYCNVVFCFI